MAVQIQSKDEKLALIRENLQEVLNPEIIEEVLDKGETLRIYFGQLPFFLWIGCCFFFGPSFPVIVIADFIFV